MVAPHMCSPGAGSECEVVRILYHHRIRSKDGQAVHLEELIAALRSSGHEVLLIGPEGFEHASFGHDPKLVVAIKKILPRAVYQLLEIAYNVPAYRRLRRACKAFEPDIIYERYNLNLFAGTWLAKRFGVPLLLEVNAPLAEERRDFGGLAFPNLAKQVEGRVWRRSDYVLPVTRVLGTKIQAAGVPFERIRVVPNAIDRQKFADGLPADDAKQTLNLADKIVLGFVGFVREWNGLENVLDLLAMPETPSSLHLLIVGDGPAIPRLKAQASQLEIADRVTFAGLVERDRVGLHLAAFDIALLPQCVEYCSPLKLFEYMAAGKAIVAPDQPNIREVLGATDALLFPPGDFGKMSDAVLTAAQNRALRDDLGCSSRRLIDEHGYTWSNNAARVIATAEEALERAKHRRAEPGATRSRPARPTGGGIA